METGKTVWEKDLAKEFNAVVIEDYNKGLLTPRVIAGVLEASREAGVPVTVDPKKENFFAYTGVALFKPNLKELREGLKTDVPAGDREAVRVREAHRQLALVSRTAPKSSDDCLERT